MQKVSIRTFNFWTAIFILIFAATFFINPICVNAQTTKYSDSIEYTVTTYEESESNLGYSPTTTMINGRPYTYYTVTEQSKPEKKPLPTTSKRTLAQGSKYATDLYVIESGQPGPIVMVVGGVHGNETAGYRAAEKVKDYSIKKGTLLVIPRVNKLAIEAGRRSAPGETDFNRLFPQSKTASPKNALAKEVYSIVKEYNVEWLMDMHEGFDYYKNSATSSVGQTLIYYPANSAKSIVEDIVNDLNKGIKTSIQKFTLLRYPVQGSLARSTAQYLGVNSFIFETSQKQTLTTRINLQEQAAKKLLSNLGMF